ncbi:MAG: MBL fold metallo-hydrolase [Candidatus Spechtbacterales bacterium]
MIITWYGQACFKIQSGEKTLVVDPFAKFIGLTPPGIQADIVFVTHEHSDHSNVKAIKGDYFLVNGPGEYEVGGVKVRGIISFHDNEKGAKLGSNTLYLIESEGIRILHCGDLGQERLEEEQLDLIGRVDILMIPVGGFFTIDARGAVGIINQIEPKIVIPMHYKIPKLTIKQLEGVDKFLKEFGEEDVIPQDKLTIKQKDFLAEEEKTRVVVMKI